MVDIYGANGKYLYCVADSGDSVSLGEIGLDGRYVYTIPYKDICAVVHNCPVEAYTCDDQGKLKKWVITHEEVVRAAWDRWRSVLPSALCTMIRVETGADPGQAVRRWLESDYQRLKEKLVGVREKAEYGVQVFWDPRAMAEKIAQETPQIKRLEEEARCRPRGLAYMYRQRLENLLKKEMEAGADRCFRECYGRIRKHADDIRVEKVRRLKADVQMILNLSCLVPQNKYTELGEELDEINRVEGLSVRFTGPWPPYSFVG